MDPEGKTSSTSSTSPGTGPIILTGFSLIPLELGLEGTTRHRLYRDDYRLGLSSRSDGVTRQFRLAADRGPYLN